MEEYTDFEEELEKAAQAKKRSRTRTRIADYEKNAQKRSYSLSEDA